jgi:hypothetical protein
MGLLTGLLTLPLAPVRATVWIAEKVAEEAARELGDENAIQQRLAALEVSFELGEIGAVEYEQRERELLDQLLAARELASRGDADGTP